MGKETAVEQLEAAAELELAALDAAAEAVTAHTKEAHTAAAAALARAAHVYAMQGRQEHALYLHKQADLHRQAAVELSEDVCDLGELDALADELGL